MKITKEPAKGNEVTIPTNRYFVKLAFDGTNYHGWQIQKNAPTVQKVLNEAFSMLLNQPVQLTGCGRTDTGVHASTFYAHVDISEKLTSDDANRFLFKLNNFLNEDIVIYRIFPVHAQAHARFSAISRTYSYVIARIKNPFQTRYAWYQYGLPDLDKMNRGADYLRSVTDFTSFSKVNTDTRTNLCAITEAKWIDNGTEIVFTITADRFLRNMVRAIVGTLLDLGNNKISWDTFLRIIESKNRSNAGESVPAHGLSLVNVTYPDDLYRTEPVCF